MQNISTDDDRSCGAFISDMRILYKYYYLLKLGLIFIFILENSQSCLLRMYIQFLPDCEYTPCGVMQSLEMMMMMMMMMVELSGSQTIQNIFTSRALFLDFLRRYSPYVSYLKNSNRASKKHLNEKAFSS
jgi:hypothetical protein